MEYLMTYGWAILIVAVVLGALFQLGVFSGSSLIPKAQPGSCKVIRPNGPGTTTFINLAGVCTGQLPQFVGNFNGASSYINAGTGASLAPTVVTISAWVNVAGLQSTQFIGGRGTTGPRGYWLGSSDTHFTFAVGNGISSLQMPVGNIAMGTWQYVVGTYDGANQIGYLNGVAVATNTIITGPIGYIGSPTPTNMYIGQITEFTSGRWWNGLISNVQIYNTSLSAAEIQGLYSEGIGGAPTRLQNLVGWWPLNGDANDYSGNGNNGAPTNVVFTSTWTR
jgi:hypothetical protein